MLEGFFFVLEEKKENLKGVKNVKNRELSQVRHCRGEKKS